MFWLKKADQIIAKIDRAIKMFESKMTQFLIKNQLIETHSLHWKTVIFGYIITFCHNSIFHIKYYH